MEMFMVKEQPNEKHNQNWDWKGMCCWKRKNILITSAIAKLSSNQFVVVNYLWKQCIVSLTEENKKETLGGFT